VRNRLIIYLFFSNTIFFLFVIDTYYENNLISPVGYFKFFRPPHYLQQTHENQTIATTGCPENGALPMHYGVEEITINVRKMLKKFYWTYLLIWRSLKVAHDNYFEINVLNCHDSYL
jgi:hypothetical protein